MANITGKLTGNISITGSGVRKGECTLTVDYTYNLTHSADSTLDFEITKGQKELHGMIDENGIIRDENGDEGIIFDINVVKNHNTYDFTVQSQFQVKTSSTNSQEL